MGSKATSGAGRARSRAEGAGGGVARPGGGFRRQGGPPLDPAVLERRRQSTATSVQRQLAHVLVSEDLAGDKVRFSCCMRLPALDYMRICEEACRGPACF